MDIKHVLSISPLQPAYRPSIAPIKPDASTASLRSGPGWWEHEGGGAAIGHRGPGFGFDNESPRHTVHLAPFALADRTVTCGEWLAFMDDGGYQRPELWLSDGWTLVRQHGWRSPLYWSPADNGGDDVPGGDGGPGGATGGDGDWQIFTLSGPRPVDPSEPVCHVSYYEADAFAHWTGYRLPTEAEWEVAAQCRPARGGFLQLDTLHPEAAPGTPFGGVWQWTSSAYSPYPGFRTATGALGEYNGKFMVNQQVLRGGSCVTPPGHVRASYRNFFPPSARWPFAGLRLARDLEGPR
jgi:ergothioneine biosynthesis protein EgtB